MSSFHPGAWHGVSAQHRPVVADTTAYSETRFPGSAACELCDFRSVT